jgi:hypothetical protein
LAQLAFFELQDKSFSLLFRSFYPRKFARHFVPDDWRKNSQI